MENELTQQRAKELFEHVDGNLIWKVNKKSAKAGNIAGCKNSRGYLTVQVDGKNKTVHRVIWLMEYGWLPKLIDHIDGDRINNVLSNLREATVSQNLCNSRDYKKKSGLARNVRWNAKSQRWNIRVMKDQKEHYIGSCKDYDEAVSMAVAARKRFFGEFYKDTSALAKIKGA